MRRAGVVITLVSLMVLVTPGIALASAGDISTVAGDGTQGFGGDGGDATAAQLNFPLGIAVDASGNLFIADYYNNRVRRVDAVTGDISTFAGTGTGGYNGDGILATAADLYLPFSVAFDDDGNLYIADSGNHRVRKVAAGTNIITTVAGSGEGSGDLGDGGPATDAVVYEPRYLAIDDDGNLAFTDFGHRVRYVAADTGVITTIAGTGNQGYSGDGGPATAAWLSNPDGVAFDSAGNVFVADRTNERVRRIDADTGIITTFAGNGDYYGSDEDGLASQVALSRPLALAIDADDNLYIGDYDAHRVRRVDGDTGWMATVAGTGVAGSAGDGGAATDAEVASPVGLALHGGDLYVTTIWKVRVIDSIESGDPDGDGIWGSLDNFPATFSLPCDGRQATILGTNGPDALDGTNGSDVIMGLGGSDTINGLGGDDTICGGNGDDVIHGESGPPVTYFGVDNDRIFGDAGADTLYGDTGIDYLSGGNGIDTLYGGAGRDRLFGGADTDTLYGGTADDRLFGGPGDDDLFGEGGEDRLRGGGGTDTLDGGPPTQGDDCIGETETTCEI